MTRSEIYLMLSEALAAANPSKKRGAPARERIEQWQTDCGHVATGLGAHHEGFDRERFLADCGAPR